MWSETKKSKCKLLERKIEYLGLEIDIKGVHILKDRIEAIEKAPTSTNVKELQAFLGMINCYDTFIIDRATKFKPMYDCLKKSNFKWTEKCQEAFENAKKILKSAPVLYNYDLEREIILACDASDYGMSAVLSHIIENEERPIAYASKTLSVSERNYSQIDKEARAIIFGITKFYNYVYGRKFKLKSDSDPLV